MPLLAAGVDAQQYEYQYGKAPQSGAAVAQERQRYAYDGA